MQKGLSGLLPKRIVRGGVHGAVHRVWQRVHRRHERSVELRRLRRSVRRRLRVQRRQVRVPCGLYRLQRRLCRPHERPGQLRKLRGELRDGRGVHGGCLRLRSRSRSLRLLVRRSDVRSVELRRLRRLVCGGPSVRRVEVRRELSERHPGLRGDLRRHWNGPEQLQRVRESVRTGLVVHGRSVSVSLWTSLVLRRLRRSVLGSGSLRLLRHGM